MTFARSNRSRRQFLRSSLAASLLSLGCAPDRPLLRACGRWFLDQNDRVILLRGINLAGNSKVPPFRPVLDPADLDPLPLLGFNVVRLLWTWEAFEPLPGQYDWGYLSDIRRVAAECWARGLYVIIDNHQDGYSRNLSKGTGDGFPLWSVASQASAYAPDNGPSCKDWQIRMATDPGMHASWAAFFANSQGVRSQYLAMMSTVARAFAHQPGVIGYDLINEPWGNEQTELPTLYEDAARSVRAEDPDSILFVEGHITTNLGLQTSLPKPRFANFAYAPHYYKPETIVTHGWHGGTLGISKAFEHMNSKAYEWSVPLFLGEFGGPAEALRIGDYVETIYDRLDKSLASGAQWNYSPLWNPIAKDGWNGEDFNILIPTKGRLRPNFRPRPHPIAVAGVPTRFGFIAGDVAGAGSFCEFSWEHHPERGETEVFVPRCRFPAGARISTTPSHASWIYDERAQRIRVQCAIQQTITLRIEA